MSQTYFGEKKLKRKGNSYIGLYPLTPVVRLDFLSLQTATSKSLEMDDLNCRNRSNIHFSDRSKGENNNGNGSTHTLKGT